MRFFYFGQAEHDEYERKKIREFQEYVAKHKIEYNRDFFHDQRLLLFLQANSFKAKETIESMQNHLDFRKQYLPIDFSKAEKLVVVQHLRSAKGSFIPVDATVSSAPSSSSTPP